MYSNGIMGLNAPGLGQNDVYPGSNQSASEYATSAQTPVSSSAINAGYDPKTDAYSGEMMARGGIASIRRFAGEDGSQVKGHYVDMGDSRTWVDDPKTESTWTPDQPVLLQSMDQMLAGDASGKSYKPTEHGYEWNGAGFVNPNGSTLSVGPSGVVTQATPSYKDYEFNGKYWNPAGENISWNPEKNQTAYKIGGVEVPINPGNTKGIAAFTDAEGKPRMQMDQNGQPIFTEPEGLRYTGNFMADTGAPMIAGLLLGGTTAFGSGAIGAGTTLANAGIAPVASTAVPTISTITPTVSTTAPTVIDAGTQAAINAASAPTYGSALSGSVTNGTALSTLPSGITSVAPVTSASMLPSAGITVAGTGTAGSGGIGPLANMTLGQKLAAATLASKMLTSGASSGTQGGTQVTAQSGTPTTTTTSIPFNPGTNTTFNQTTPTYNMPTSGIPTMGSYSPNTGLAYQPLTYRYAAQGGLMYADGGIADLGGYAVGGKLLKGPGDGMSDSIEANIGGQQPARLADGEFVVPADVVSHLGNGSTDAGAKHLYKMMDKIRKARTGNPKQGKKINADKFLPRN